jgi:hypothetical protein
MTIGLAKIIPVTEEELQEKFFTILGNNDSPFDTKFGTGNFLMAPKYIYFYKLCFDGSRIKVDHFFWHQGNPTSTAQEINALGAIVPRGITPGNGEIGIDDALATIAGFAHADSPANPSPWKRTTGEDFDDPAGSGMLLWTIRSYVAFMIDDSAWEILRLNGRPAITFDNENPGQGTKGNHSFYDAFDETISVTADNSVKRNVVCMINHMKRGQAGDDLLAPGNPGHRQQNFKFNIFAKVRLQGWENDNRRQLIVMIDPPGGNQGPPDAP